jgi:hypothetical protein
MTKGDFIKILKGYKYTYEIEGDKIIVLENGSVNFDNITAIPSGVEFRNKTHVYMSSIITLPPDVIFSNEGSVWLSSVKSISRGVEFRNKQTVGLASLFHGWFHLWEDMYYIKGINHRRLLNLMISKGIFER